MGVHDRLFKELLGQFTYEFIELFLPEVQDGLEPGSLHFLDKEMFTELVEGDLAFFVIHLEHQAKSKGLEQFPLRMFTYLATKGLPLVDTRISASRLKGLRALP